MMYSPRAARVACAAILALASWSCDDDPSGPENLDYPTLSSELQTTLCVRGNATSGQTKTGSISAADCDDNQGYAEYYVVKVGTTRVVTFTVNSTFDSFLTLLRIDSFTATTANLSELDTDDESAGNQDARLSFTLEAGTNYLIAVSGVSIGQLGTYSMTIE